MGAMYCAGEMPESTEIVERPISGGICVLPRGKQRDLARRKAREGDA